MTKLYKEESQFFAERFLCPSSSKYNFTVPSKKHTVFELLHHQNPYFYFFANVSKRTKDILKKFKKQRPAMKSALSN